MSHSQPATISNSRMGLFQSALQPLAWYTPPNRPAVVWVRRLCSHCAGGFRSLRPPKKWGRSISVRVAERCCFWHLRGFGHGQNDRIHSVLEITLDKCSPCELIRIQRSILPLLRLGQPTARLQKVSIFSKNLAEGPKTKTWPTFWHLFGHLIDFGTLVAIPMKRPKP